MILLTLMLFAFLWIRLGRVERQREREHLYAFDPRALDVVDIKASSTCTLPDGQPDASVDGADKRQD